MAKVLDYDGLDYVVDKIYDLVNSGGSADFIVEQGTSGIWTYRKWASGVAECWGTDKFNVNQGNTVRQTNFPTNLFLSGSTVCGFASCGATNTVESWVKYVEVNPTYFATYVYSANQSTQSMTLFRQAKGIWKAFTPSVSARSQIGLENLTSQMASGTNSWELRQNVLSHCHRFGNLLFISAYGVMTATVTNGMTLAFCKIPVRVQTLLTGGCSVGGVSYPLIELKDYNGVQYLHEDIMSNISSGTAVCFWAVCAI